MGKKKEAEPEPEPAPESEPEPKKRDIGKFLKRSALIASAGGLAGGVESFIASPLQAIVARLIVQPILTDPRKKCGNIIDCMHKIHSSNGAYGFYKDLPSQLISGIPRKAILFFTYKTIYDYLIQSQEKDKDKDKDKPKEEGKESDKTPDEGPSTRQILAPFIGGAIAGLAEAFIANPFETIRTNVQAMKCKQCVTAPSQMSEQVYTKLVREGGFGGKGLNKGLTASLLRHGLFNLCYFGFYPMIKPMMCCGYSERKGCTTNNYTCTFYAAFLSGVIGSIVSSPFHIAQTRLQAPHNENQLCRYHTAFQTLKVVQREEGIHALWRGLLSRMLRYGIGGGALMVAYEYFHNKIVESPEPPKEPEKESEPPPPPPEEDLKAKKGGKKKKKRLY